MFDNILFGFSNALSPLALLYCFIGCFLGTLIGVLPGIGPTATIAMLLPITFKLPPAEALIMLAGIYYGAQYGGSTTSILVNLPGEASSVVTCLDGHQMARKGRAGVALSIAAIGSFFAGSFATLMLGFFSPPLAEVAFKFGSAEYFSLIVFGLVAAVVMASGSLIKAIAVILLGMLIGIVGTDVTSGVKRFTFSIWALSEGIEFVTIAMGMFGLGEIINNLEVKEKRVRITSHVDHLMPTKSDLKASWKPIIRGTAIGSLLGILPGGGGILSSFASYTLEKRIAKDPSRFGKGAIEGVAGPESANNAGAQMSFVPMLTMGIPSNAVMALMVGGMMIQGIVPGPEVITRHPEIFWGLIASMWIGNVMLLVLNLPLIGIWVRLLTVPYRILFPAILTFCCIGVYTLNNSVIDVVLMACFGLLGYFLKKIDCELAPLLLGVILGPMVEEHLRRAMQVSHGDPTIFITRPISLVLLIISALLLLFTIIPKISSKRQEIFKE